VTRCQICLDTISEPAIDLVRYNKLDTSAHDDMNAEHNNVCQVLKHNCGSCLMEYIEDHERDPNKDEKGCPCLTCRIPLRAIPAENMARRAVARFQRQSPAFQGGCARLIAMVDDAMTLPDRERAEMRKTARHLVISLCKQDQARKDDLQPIKQFQSSPWYRDAFLMYTADEKAFWTARAYYRNLLD